MSKVENQEGLIYFDEILCEIDAFMVARGDLGMKIPVEKIFLAQKMMIYKCNLAGKPVVTATKMLESMIKSPRPTVQKPQMSLMLFLMAPIVSCFSGESAAGSYPELAVKIMARICIEAESSLDYGVIFKEMIRSIPLPISPLESLASSAVRTSNNAEAKLIVVLARGYMSTPLHLTVKEYVTTEKFAIWKEYGESNGFRYVASGPLVRSSYRAGELFIQTMVREKGQNLNCKLKD